MAILIKKQCYISQNSTANLKRNKKIYMKKFKDNSTTNGLLH